MNSSDALAKLIFQKEALHDCSLEDLQAISEAYPYFAPVQLLLAEKLKANGGSSYNEQLEKISLHFSNPLWLDFLLNGSKKDSMPIPDNENANSNEAIEIEVKDERVSV